MGKLTQLLRIRFCGGNNGITFEGLENTLLTISNNDAIVGEYKNGIEISGPVKAASKIIISDNTRIKGRNDGIDIGDIIGTEIAGETSVLISGNETISGGNDGIDIDSVENAFVTISDNGSITGFDDGIVIDGPIKAASKIIISDNTLIKARDGDGIEIGDVIGTEIAGETNVLISGNETISGGNNGILFGSLENTLLTISNNDAIIGEYKDGIEINGPVKAASKIIISNNTLIKGP